jgi:hypothetical protein
LAFVFEMMGSVMICQWAERFMQLTTFLTTTGFGESNGSEAGYNTSVPSDPLIDVCLAELPAGETNPLSARSRSSQTKRTVKISVGLLPYISIASVWQQRRPVVTDFAACRHRLPIDTSSCRMVALGDPTSSANAIPRSSYLFGGSWANVRRTLLVAVEQDGDPYAVLVPTAEIIRFYYAPSTRLAQALFWGEYNDASADQRDPIRAAECRSMRLASPREGSRTSGH